MSTVLGTVLGTVPINWDGTYRMGTYLQNGYVLGTVAREQIGSNKMDTVPRNRVRYQEEEDGCCTWVECSGWREGTINIGTERLSYSTGRFSILRLLLEAFSQHVQHLCKGRAIYCRNLRGPQSRTLTKVLVEHGLDRLWVPYHAT